jgi:uncharacterized protein (TIGR03083 family)
MTLEAPAVQPSLDAVRDTAERFAALLRSTEDVTTPAIGHWDIGQTAAHVTHIYSIMPRLLEGSTSPVSDHRQMGGTWERLLAEDEERDTSVLAERIETSARTFLERVDITDWTKEVNWHGGLRAPVYTLASILVNEGEIHGYDIARASGKPWTISQGKARISLRGIYPLMPHFVDKQRARGLDANFSVDLRDGKPTYMLVHDGALKVTSDQPSRVDCRISAQPVEYTLVGYGRISQVKPLLTGKIVAYGRKPWLGLRFAKLFYSF